MIREALLAALVLLGALALAVWVAARLHRAQVRDRGALAERAARAALEAAGITRPITEKLHAEIAALHVLVRDMRRRQVARDAAAPPKGSGAPRSEVVTALPLPSHAPFFPPSEDSVDEPTRVLERPCRS